MLSCANTALTTTTTTRVIYTARAAAAAAAAAAASTDTDVPAPAASAAKRTVQQTARDHAQGLMAHRVPQLHQRPHQVRGGRRVVLAHPSLQQGCRVGHQAGQALWSPSALAHDGPTTAVLSSATSHHTVAAAGVAASTITSTIITSTGAAAIAPNTTTTITTTTTATTTTTTTIITAVPIASIFAAVASLFTARALSGYACAWQCL